MDLRPGEELLLWMSRDLLRSAVEGLEGELVEDRDVGDALGSDFELGEGNVDNVLADKITSGIFALGCRDLIVMPNHRLHPMVSKSILLDDNCDHLQRRPW